MNRYKWTFLIIGVLLVGIGFQLPTDTAFFYWLSIILYALGGFITGYSLRKIIDEEN